MPLLFLSHVTFFYVAARRPTLQTLWNLRFKTSNFAHNDLHFMALTRQNKETGVWKTRPFSFFSNKLCYYYATSKKKLSLYLFAMCFNLKINSAIILMISQLYCLLNLKQQGLTTRRQGLATVGMDGACQDKAGLSSWLGVGLSRIGVASPAFQRHFFYNHLLNQLLCCEIYYLLFLKMIEMIFSK